MYYILYSQSYLYNAVLAIQLMNFYKGNALYSMISKNFRLRRAFNPPFIPPILMGGVGRRPTAVATALLRRAVATAVVDYAPLRALRSQTLVFLNLYTLLLIRNLSHLFVLVREGCGDQLYVQIAANNIYNIYKHMMI